MFAHGQRRNPPNLNGSLGGNRSAPNFGNISFGSSEDPTGAEVEGGRRARIRQQLAGNVFPSVGQELGQLFSNQFPQGGVGMGTMQNLLSKIGPASHDTSNQMVTHTVVPKPWGDNFQYDQHYDTGDLMFVEEGDDEMAPNHHQFPQRTVLNWQQLNQQIYLGRIRGVEYIEELARRQGITDPKKIKVDVDEMMTIHRLEYNSSEGANDFESSEQERAMTIMVKDTKKLSEEIELLRNVGNYVNAIEALRDRRREEMRNRSQEEMVRAGAVRIGVENEEDEIMLQEKILDLVGKTANEILSAFDNYKKYQVQNMRDIIQSALAYLHTYFIQRKYDFIGSLVDGPKHRKIYNQSYNRTDVVTYSGRGPTFVKNIIGEGRFMETRRNRGSSFGYNTRAPQVNLHNQLHLVIVNIGIGKNGSTDTFKTKGGFEYKQIGVVPVCVPNRRMLFHTLDKHTLNGGPLSYRSLLNDYEKVLPSWSTQPRSWFIGTILEIEPNKQRNDSFYKQAWGCYRNHATNQSLKDVYDKRKYARHLKVNIKTA
ncbi:MAG: hypothetical protein ACTSUE_04180 [Promethearchaeota archaeon]